jgi:DsbC/DsbD-like thiol-disulfide interchange protein
MNRNGLFLILSVMIVFAQFVPADMYRKEEPVKVEFTPANPSAPGSQIKTQLELYIEQGYHLFSNKPEVPGIKSTVVEIEKSDQFEVEKIVYPNPEPVYSDIFQRKLGLYQGKVVIPIQLRLNTKAKDTVAISGKIQFQTCSDKVCYPPKFHQFSGNQKITEAN